MNREDRRREKAKAGRAPDPQSMGFDERDKSIKAGHELIAFLDKKFPPNTVLGETHQLHAAALLLGNILGRDSKSEVELEEGIGMVSLFCRSHAMQRFETGSVMKPGDKSGLYGVNLEEPLVFKSSNTSPSGPKVMPSSEALDRLNAEQFLGAITAAAYGESQKISDQLDQVFDLSDRRQMTGFTLTLGICAGQAIGRVLQTHSESEEETRGLLNDIMGSLTDLIILKISQFLQTGTVYEDQPEMKSKPS